MNEVESLVYRLLGDSTIFVSATLDAQRGLAQLDKQADKTGKNLDEALGSGTKAPGGKSPAKRLSEDLSSTERVARRLSGAFSKVGTSIKGVKRDILESQRASEKWLNSTQQAFGKVSAGALALGASMSAMFGGTAGVSIFKAGEYEQTLIAFETLIGSADETHKTLAMLTDFAAKTPFEMPEILQAARGLIMFGERGDDLYQTLLSLGNAAAGTSSNFGELALIYNQIRGVGKLLTQDFRQLSTRGVMSLQDIADYYDVATDKAQAMLSSGQITFEDLKNILAGLSSDTGRFANLMEKQSTSFLGLMSTLKDAFSIELRKIGMELLPLGKAFLEFALTGIEAFAELPPIFKSGTATVLALGAGLGLALTGLSALLAVAGTAITTLPALATAITAVVGALDGLVLMNAVNWGWFASVPAITGLSVALGVMATAVTGVAAAWYFHSRTMGEVNEQVDRSEKLHKRLIMTTSQFNNSNLADIKKVEDIEKRRVAVSEALATAEKNRIGIQQRLQGLINQRASMGEGSFYENMQDYYDSKEVNQQIKETRAMLDQHQDYIKKLVGEQKQIQEDAEAAGMMSEETEKKFAQYLDNLRMENEMVGMSAIEREKYKWAMQGATKQQQELIEGLLKEKKTREDIEKVNEKFKESKDSLIEDAENFQRGLMGAYHSVMGAAKEAGGTFGNILTGTLGGEALEKLTDQANQFKDTLKTPFQNAAEEAENLRRMLDNGLITNEEFAEGVARIKDRFDESGRSVKEFYQSLNGGQNVNVDQIGLTFGVGGIEDPGVTGGNRREFDNKEPVKIDDSKQVRTATGLEKYLDKLIETTKEKDPIVVNLVNMFGGGDN